MKEYRQTLTEFDDSGFKKLGRNERQRGQVLFDNLWGMFGLTPEVRKNEKARLEAEGKPMWCVSEFAWSKEVKRKFYAHPYHRRFVSQMKGMRGMTWGLWVLDAEPADLDGGYGEA